MNEHPNIAMIRRALDRFALELVFLVAALTSSSLNAWTETTERPS